MPASAGVVLVVILLVGLLLLHRFAVFPTVVRSESMRPSLEPGDVVLAGRMRRRSRLRRGEILLYRDPDRTERRLGRIIGMPGDRVHLGEGGAVSIDGEAVFEPYAVRAGGFRGSFTVPGDRVFVLGDQRRGSHDPRAWRESFVPLGDVVGIARVRLLPWPIAPTGVLAR